MMSTPELMTLEHQLLTVIESLQNALQVGEKATDHLTPVDANGDAFLDVLTGDPSPSYSYAYGWSSACIKNAITSLELIRQTIN